MDEFMLNESLISAAREGIIEKVEDCISKGADVDYQDVLGYTPLIWATIRGHIEIVELLLINKANPNITDKFWQSPLHYANTIHIAQLLISHGASINATDKLNGETVLHVASRRGNNKLMKYYIDVGVPVNSRNSNGWTPLHWAGNKATASVLISHGADKGLSYRGDIALHSACRYGRHEVIDYLLDQGMDIKALNNYGESPVDLLKQHWSDSQPCIDVLRRRGLYDEAATNGDGHKYFLEAMAECEEEITQLNIMLHGPPGVGKTSLSRIILGEEPLPKNERNSTNIMENPIRAIKASQLNEFEGQFEKISEEKLIHLIAEFLKKRMKLHDEVQPQHEIQPHDEILIQPNRQDIPLRNQPPTLHNSIPADSTSTLDTLKDINNVLSSVQPSSKMFSSKWLNLIDSGGQPQFQDMLPLLFKGPSFQIVLMRLTEGLEDKPKMCYTVEGENIVPPDDLHLTNLQYIERACQIAADANPPSKVMIVGTHKDELSPNGDVTAMLDTLEKGLGDLRKTYKHVILPTKAGKTVFPMNTMATGEERKEYTKEMQDAITAVVTDRSLAKPQSIPLRWFVFQLALRNKASVIRMKDCIEIGHLLGMKEDAVKEALVFFNQSALLLYYPDADPDLVLTKVDPVIERLSQLVTTTFQVPPQLRAYSHLCTKLKEKGLFDAAFCDKIFCKAGTHFTDGLINQEFLKLLVLLRLVVLVDEKEYFLPSALSYLSPTESADSKDACGFILEDYKNNVSILPHSFYFTSVVELLSNENHIFEIPNCTQYRNRIQVHDKSRKIPAVVILSDKTWWIQVSHSLLKLPSKNPSYGNKICKVVKQSINLAKERLQLHTAVASITRVFPCPIKDHNCDHYCTVTTDNKYYTCSSDPSQCGPVTEDMIYWMEGSSLDHSKQLTSFNMFKLLKDKSSKWSDIGQAFGVSENDRDTLCHDAALTDNNRLEKVLGQWLESISHPTWAQFLKVVIDLLKFNDVAEQVKAFLDQQ